MATSKGKNAVKKYLAQVPELMRRKVLRGAARAAVEVIADEARQLTNSDEIRGAIKTTVREEPGRIVGKVQVKGPGAYLAPWAEYGTAPHYITVDASQSEGRSVRRVNSELRKGSLVINGQPVGSTVLHPGARAHPFMRPALDRKGADGIRAAQGYITTKLSRAGLVGLPDDEDGNP